MKNSSLSWKPRRRARGSVYCSPACGGNCLRSDFDRATQDAARLAARLGPRWTTRVWENLGWYYEVISPGKSIRVSKYRFTTRYIATLAVANFRAEARTPREAVIALLDRMVTEATRLLAIVHEVGIKEGL